MALRASARSSSGISVDRLAQGSARPSADCAGHERSLEGGRGGTSLDPRRMSYSTSACVRAAASKPRRSSRKSTSPNSMGVVAVVCVVLGCAWTVYANVLRADVYPTLGVLNYDAPVVRRSATGAVHKVQPNADTAVAPLGEPALQGSASARILPGPSLSFTERFAASAAQGVDPKQ